MAGYDTGCHICGGAPGNKDKNRATLYQCQDCGTYTCNQHRTIMGACPNCKSGRMKAVLTSADIARKKTGGMPAGGGTGRNKPGKKGAQDDDDLPLARSGFGGGDVPRSAMDNASRSGAIIDAPVRTPDQQHNWSEHLGIHQPQQEEPYNRQQTGVHDIAEDELGDRVQYLNIRVAGVIASDEAQKGEATATIVIDPSAQNKDQGIMGRIIGAALTAAGEIEEETVSELSDSDIDQMLVQLGETDTQDAADIRDTLNNIKARRVRQSGQGSQLRGDLDVGGEDTSYDADEAAKARADVEEELAALESIKREKTKVEAGASRLISLLETTRTKETFYADAYCRVDHADAIKRYQGFYNDIRKDTQLSARFYMSLLSCDADQLAQTPELLQLMTSTQDIYAATGYGPQKATQLTTNALDNLKRLILSNNKIIGIGDIGLDLHFSPYTLKQQRALLEAQLALAAEFKMPALLSARKADHELAEIIDAVYASTPFNGIYVGLLTSDRLLAMCQAHEFYVCLRPELTYPENEAMLELIDQLPLDQLLMCSGLEAGAPAPKRGWWNDPRFIDHTLAYVARYKGISQAELALACCKNMARLMFTEPAT